MGAILCLRFGGAEQAKEPRSQAAQAKKHGANELLKPLVTTR